MAISKGSLKVEKCYKWHRKLGLYPEDLVDLLADGSYRDARERFPIHPIPDKTVYEFYDVLWVEFEDGVAYRKDIGRVCKEVWDHETLGWVDVTLG